MELSTDLKDEDIEPLPKYQYVVIYLFVFFFIVGMVSYTIVGNHKDYHFLLEKLINFIIIGTVYYLNGKILVQKYKIKINYTRKINHFTIWVLPFLIDYIFDLESSLTASLWNIVFALLGFVLLTIPIRRKINFLNVIYSSLDRPEDRPNTLRWLTLQNFLTGLSLTPFLILWNNWNTVNFKFIPLFIATFGDGFAEIIGVRFGKHKYETRALFTDKKYTRSFEGSACVFVTAVIMIFAIDYNFTTLEFILNGLLIPPLTTLTEAYAPHTMDNPFIILVASGILSLCHLF